MKTFNIVKALKGDVLTTATTFASSSLNSWLVGSLSSTTNGSIKTADRTTTGAETAAVVVLVVVIAAVVAVVTEVVAATVVVV